MKEFYIVARLGKNLKKWSTNELTAANDGDFMMGEVDAIARKKPENGGSGSGIIIAVAGETVDIFGGSDKAGKFLSLRGVENGELKNDAVDGRIAISGVDFTGDVVGRFSEIIFDNGADVFAVLNLEIDIFSNDGIVAISDDEQVWLSS